MSKPIAPAQGIAFAFPDVCNTPTPGGPVPIPYPNVAQLGDAQDVATDLLVGPSETPVLLVQSVVQTSTGSPPNVTGVSSGSANGSCEMSQGSSSVIYGSNSLGVVRFGDQTQQNGGNVPGIVLGAFPTVLVGD
jgi:hypothetical protein